MQVDWTQITDEMLYSELGRRRSARVQVRRKPTCECGECKLCKQRARNQRSRENKKVKTDAR